MPRNALQHSHICLHTCTSTHSQNKVSLCPQRGIFTCTDITGGGMSLKQTHPETGRTAYPRRSIRQGLSYLHFPPSSGTGRLGISV